MIDDCVPDWISPYPKLEIEATEMRDRVDNVFTLLDLNRDGVVTREEFVESCLQVSLTHDVFVVCL